MAENNAEPTDGIHFQNGSTDIAASDASVDHILRSVERLWFGTLDWIAIHPIFGSVFIGLFVLIIFLFYRLKSQKQRLEFEYKVYREKAQIQPSLPLDGKQRIEHAQSETKSRQGE